MSEKGVAKPTSTEDEFFAREDAEKKRKLALQVKKQMDAEERERLKKLHWMRCPKCGMEMQELRFRGIDADACFACGGVFLDKGEMDVIAHPQQKGIMAAILNLFSDEARPGGKK